MAEEKIKFGKGIIGLVAQSKQPFLEEHFEQSPKKLCFYKKKAPLAVTANALPQDILTAALKPITSLIRVAFFMEPARNWLKAISPMIQGYIAML